MHFSCQNFKQFHVTSLECPCIAVEIITYRSHVICPDFIGLYVAFSMPCLSRHFTITAQALHVHVSLFY